MSTEWPSRFQEARRMAGMNQQEAAARAGLSRMTVQKLEAGSIDPRLSTVQVLLRALGLDLVLVPSNLRPAVEDFIRAGGRIVSQPSGIGAPLSVVDALVASAPSPPSPPGARKKKQRRSP